MGAIAIRCPECGATIPAPESSSVATCTYCGTRSQVRRRTRFLEIPQPAAQLPGPPLPVAMQRHSARWAVGLFLVPLAIGGAITVSALAQRDAASGPASLTRPGWDGTKGAALVDVDGDGTIDIVGRADVHQPVHEAMIGAWHGTTGKRLWITASVGLRRDHLQAPLGVAGKVVLTSDGLAGVSAFNLADGTPLWAIRLNEKIEQFCAADDGMVRVQTSDDQLHPIRLADGALQPAGASAPCVPLPGDNVRGDRSAWTVWSHSGIAPRVPGTKIPGLSSRAALHHRASGLSLALAEKTPGTRVPMIAAFRWPAEDDVDLGALERQARETSDPKERNRLREIVHAGEKALRDRMPEVLWSAQVPGVDPLSVSEGEPDPEHVALDATSVVVAYQTRTTHEYRFAGFAMSDGRRLWDIPIPGKFPLAAVELSPTHALVSRWDGLRAFDRATGALVFTIP